MPYLTGGCKGTGSSGVCVVLVVEKGFGMRLEERGEGPRLLKGGEMVTDSGSLRHVCLAECQARQSENDTILLKAYIAFNLSLGTRANAKITQSCTILKHVLKSDMCGASGGYRHMPSTATYCILTQFFLSY